MYTKSTICYANRIEHRLYHDYYHQSTGKRRERIRPTPDQMAENNRRNSIRQLTRLIMNNFVFGDCHVVLTYSDENRPDPEGARKILKNFMARLRRYYKKFEVQLKWVMVTEWERTNIHHHMILNDVPGLMKAVAALWPGGNHFTPLYDNYNYEGLAKYFVKETDRSFRDPDSPYRQRYTHSRNLVKPAVRKEKVRADTWRDNPGPTPREAAQGYRLDQDSVLRGFDNAGYPFLEYILIRDESYPQWKIRETERHRIHAMHEMSGIPEGDKNAGLCGYPGGLPGKSKQRKRKSRDRPVVPGKRKAGKAGSGKGSASGRG